MITIGILPDYNRDSIKLQSGFFMSPIAMLNVGVRSGEDEGWR